MKKVLYTLLAASVSLTACNKQDNAIPKGTSASATDIDFKDAKAYVRSGQLKTTEEGVVIDYDFYIKETSTNKYTAAIRLNGIRANGQKLNGVKFNGSQDAYRGVTIGLSITGDEQSAESAAKVETNFAILLDGAKGEKVGDVVVFDPFGYNGDLVNNVVDAKVKLTIGGGSLEIKDNSTVVLGGSTISLKENSNITISGGNLNMYDEASFFVTRSGMTVEQKPSISIVRLRKNTLQGQTYGRVTVIVDNDPNNEVASLTYEPAPIALDPNKPDVLTKLPIMEFKETHYNKQLGMHRYESTQTWTEVYGKYGISPLFFGNEGLRIQTLRHQ